MAKVYDKIAYNSFDDFVYGSCPNPVKAKSGLVIGGGEIYPELNYTLPAMSVNPSTIKDAYKIYKDMTNGVLDRARQLEATGMQFEYETVPEFTDVPEWGIEVSKIIVDTMAEYNAKYGLKSSYRATPNDLREMTRPPVMKSGSYWEKMLKSFEGCAKAGADFISVESTGGKELHDDALVNADIRKVVFSLSLGCRDMKFLWKNIVDICNKNGAIAGGDSSCGFGNTAMVLAGNGFIPKVFAAVVRVATVSRALCAYEMGATGPSKDCEYAGPYLKAITGAPIAMEGKMAACAHLSAVGNIPAAVADLWSNESVQQVKLLSGMAPVVSIEQLVYDCRLMNEAKKQGFGTKFRDLLADADSKLDPQAYIIRPDVAFELSKEIVKVQDPFLRTKVAAQLAVQKLKKAIANNEVKVQEREMGWLDIMEGQLDDIPDDELKFYAEIKGDLDADKFLPAEYGL